MTKKQKTKNTENNSYNNHVCFCIGCLIPVYLDAVLFL